MIKIVLLILESEKRICEKKMIWIRSKYHNNEYKNVKCICGSLIHYDPNKLGKEGKHIPFNEDNTIHICPFNVKRYYFRRLK